MKIRAKKIRAKICDIRSACATNFIS